MKQDDKEEDYEQKQQEVTLQKLERFNNQLSELYEQNINLRMKYPTEPMRFYHSEQEIDNILRSLQTLGQEQIPLIIQSNLLSAILKLLNHPNQDINICCIQFLHELISQQPQKDQIFQMYYRLCVWLVQNGLYQNLIETLNKMNQQESVEEYQVSLQILKIIQTLTQQLQSSVQSLINDTKIIEYLSNRIMPNYVVNHKVIDDNKYVGSDLLAFLLSNSQLAQSQFHQQSGMEILIQSIRPYLSKTPTSSDQKQYLGNLFDCINILLINGSQELIKSRIVYHKMKGNQIMLIIVKTKGDNAVSALKAIANSFTNLQSQIQGQIIEELIQFGGLKYIFPILMRQGIKSKDIDEQMVIDQNGLRIVFYMVVATSQIYKMRVDTKFTQKRFQKLQKLFEIRTQYMQNMGKQALKEVGPEQYFQKLKEGLSVVEIIDKILSSLVTSTSTVKHKLVVLMKLYGVMAGDLEFTLKTKYAFIGSSPEKGYLQHLLAENIPLLRQLTNKQSKQ